MQGLSPCSNDVVSLDLTPMANSSSSSFSSSSSLTIDVDESAETRIQRLISEHPVVIFARSSCCMCHVMKNLLSTIGVHPAVIELDDHEIAALPLSDNNNNRTRLPALPNNRAPAVFIGGTYIGGLESLVALHVSGHLVPKLVQIGALWTQNSLTIDVDESAETRIQRLISEHPVVIFARSSCCMCHVMKNLLSTIGVHPAVIELDDHEIAALRQQQ